MHTCFSKNFEKGQKNNACPKADAEKTHQSVRQYF